MFEKLENSWKLAKECWRILMLDKEMLAFPFMAFMTTIVVLGGISYPLWSSSIFNPSTPEPMIIDSSFAILSWALLCIVPGYICYFIAVFFNAGLITCSFIRLCEGDPVVKDGLAMAWHRLPQIFTWSVLAATVGLLLRMVKGNNTILRSVFGSTLELGWRVAGYFTLPIIVAEEKGALKALKGSGQLIRKNWGEALTLEIGFSILAYPALVPFFALFAMAYAMTSTMPLLSSGLIIIALIYVFVISLVIATLDAIAKAALYMYAVGNGMPEGFQPGLLEKMFKQTNVEKPFLA